MRGGLAGNRHAPPPPGGTAASSGLVGANRAGDHPCRQPLAQRARQLANGLDPRRGDLGEARADTSP
jgi:hypothetical protein